MAKQQIAKGGSDPETIRFNWFQICNILRLTGYNREIVRQKYEDDVHTTEEWEDLLKKDGLNF